MAGTVDLDALGMASMLPHTLHPYQDPGSRFQDDTLNAVLGVSLEGSACCRERCPRSGLGERDNLLKHGPLPKIQ